MRKEKRKYLLFSLLILILSFFVSCKDSSSELETFSEKPVKVTLQACMNDNSKLLQISDNIEVKEYVYKAVPNFSYSDGKTPHGAQSEWTHFCNIEDTSGTIELTQGNWTITIGLTNTNDDVVYSGSATTYITAKTRSATVILAPTEGKGTISMSVNVPQVSESGGTLVLNYRKIGESQAQNKTLTETGRTQGIISYEDTISDLDTGFYILSFNFSDDTTYAGQTVSIQVLNGLVSEVEGDLSTSLFYQTQVSVALPTPISGTINTDDIWVSAGTAVTTSWSGTECDGFEWAVNGTKVQTGLMDSYTFTPQTNGTYTVSCIGYKDVGLQGASYNAGFAALNVHVSGGVTVTIIYYDGSAESVEIFSGQTIADVLIKRASVLNGITYEAALYNSTEGSGTAYDSSTVVSNDMMAYAHRKQYILAWNGNGVELSGGSSAGTYYQGVDIIAPAAEKTGYTLSGWNPSFTGKMPTNNVEYIALWLANNYFVKFNANKPSAASNNVSGSMSNEELTYDIAKTLTKNAFSLTGWTWSGWTTIDDGSGTSYTDEQSILNLSSQNGEIINLYAKWVAKTYTVTINADSMTGGHFGDSTTQKLITVTYDSTYGAAGLPDPSTITGVEGYTCTGYSIAN